MCCIDQDQKRCIYEETIRNETAKKNSSWNQVEKKRTGNVNPEVKNLTKKRCVKETDHYKAKQKRKKEKDQGYSAYLISHPHDKKKQKKTNPNLKNLRHGKPKKRLYI